MYNTIKVVFMEQDDWKMGWKFLGQRFWGTLSEVLIT